jgi:hypothetical protein
LSYFLLFLSIFLRPKKDSKLYKTIKNIILYLPQTLSIIFAARVARRSSPWHHAACQMWTSGNPLHTNKTKIEVLNIEWCRIGIDKAQ